jgi:hypothetical protein
VTADSWPDHLLGDVSPDARFARMNALQDLLIAKTGFPKEEVQKALGHPHPETKEKVSIWLRAELKKLSAGQKRGEHPVRRGKTISLPQIADAVFTMLEANYTINDKLLALIQELLEVGRHRRTLAANREKFEQAADFEAVVRLQGNQSGVRAIARYVIVSTSTASQWRRSLEFQALVSKIGDAWRRVLSEYVDSIKRKYPEIGDVHATCIAYSIYALTHLKGVTHAELKNDAILLPKIVKELRTNFAQPPISLNFLPSKDFSRVSTKNLRRRKSYVIQRTHQVIGHPNPMDQGAKKGVRHISS